MAKISGEGSTHTINDIARCCLQEKVIVCLMLQNPCGYGASGPFWFLGRPPQDKGKSKIPSRYPRTNRMCMQIRISLCDAQREPNGCRKLTLIPSTETIKKSECGSKRWKGRIEYVEKRLSGGRIALKREIMAAKAKPKIVKGEQALDRRKQLSHESQQRVELS
jgi:hypothetical protein